MKALKTIYISIFMALILGFFSGIAWATPSAQALYWENALVGGLWKYDYILSNTSDVAGSEVFDFTLYFDPAVTLSNILSPINWYFISGSGDPSIPLPSFIDWYSDFGAEITPGNSLSGFSFQVNYQAGNVPFDVYLTNPIYPGNPVLYSGNTAPVPEPSTMLLLGAGLAGLVGLRKRLKIIG